RIDVARTDVFCRLRIGAQRPRQGRRHALANHLVRGDTILNPIDQRIEISTVARPGPRGAKAEDRRATMADTRRMEQAIEALHTLEAASIVPRLVTFRHLPVVVEDAAWIDE